MSNSKNIPRSPAQHLFDSVAHGSMFASDGKTRKYVSAFDMSSSYDGQLYTKRHNLCWEIDVSHKSSTSKSIVPADLRKILEKACGHPGGGHYSTPENVTTALKLIKFRTTMVPDFAYFNFDSMVFALTSMMAYYTWNPKSRANSILSTPLDVSSLNQPLASHAVGNSAVFIPQSLSGNNSSQLFGVLVLAANATGSHVYTDHLTMDAEDKPRVMLPDGVMFPYLIARALNILAELYNSAGAGEGFALAATCGLHAVNSVVGHSDEGGMMRDILRRVTFPPSFGGIPPNPAVSGGVGGLDLALRYESVTRWVDSYSLLTAAAVAHCDPLIYESGDKFFPTILSTDGTSDDEMARTIFHKLMLNFGAFSRLYVNAITSLYGLTGDPDGGLASSVLVSAAENLGADLSTGAVRHAGRPVVCPYFWIEPTGLLHSNHFGTPAEREHYASIVGPNGTIDVGMLEGCEIMGNSNALYSEIIMPLLSLRRSPLMLWGLNDRFGSGGSMVFRQIDANGILLPGPKALSPDVAFEKDVPIGFWTWVRGQSKLLHPCEVVNMGGTAMVRIYHQSITYDGPHPQLIPSCGLPSNQHIGSARLHGVAGRLVPVAPGTACEEPKALARVRARAARSLESVLMRNRQGAVYPASESAKLSIAPGLRGTSAANRGTEDAKLNEVLLAVAVPTASPDEAKSVKANTSPLKPERVHGAQTVPRIPNQGPVAMATESSKDVYDGSRFSTGAEGVSGQAPTIAGQVSEAVTTVSPGGVVAAGP